MGRSRDLANLLNSSGQVPDAKLLALAASKLTGQVPDANAPSGSVLQVVNTSNNTPISSTIGAEAYLGLSASITPTFATSKILVVFSVAAGLFETSAVNMAMRFALRRGTTTSSDLIARHRFGRYGSSESWNKEIFGSVVLTGLDSPNTTSQVTYGLFASDVDGTPDLRVNDGAASYSSFTLIEVAA